MQNQFKKLTLDADNAENASFQYQQVGGEYKSDSDDVINALTPFTIPVGDTVISAHPFFTYAAGVFTATHECTVDMVWSSFYDCTGGATDIYIDYVLNAVVVNSMRVRTSAVVLVFPCFTMIKRISFDIGDTFLVQSREVLGVAMGTCNIREETTRFLILDA